jgi:hypothetical protein
MARLKSLHSMSLMAVLVLGGSDSALAREALVPAKAILPQITVPFVCPKSEGVFC